LGCAVDQKGVVGDLSRIRTVGLTGPDPDGTVSEDCRVATDCRAARNSAVAVRTLHALARGTEAQPVISTLHDVVGQLAVMQWHALSGRSRLLPPHLTLLRSHRSSCKSISSIYRTARNCDGNWNLHSGSRSTTTRPPRHEQLRRAFRPWISAGNGCRVPGRGLKSIESVLAGSRDRCATQSATK
jgi:hypothetical protein